MSCYGCGASFGLFHKEHGCKNCGFAFCGKCLTKKHEVPKLNNEKHKVCNKCYNILTGKIKPEEKKRDVSPPEAYKKRVAALQEREEHGKGSPFKKQTAKGTPKHPSHPHPSHSRAEREIEERLQKLKEKTPEQVAKENVSEKEIKERLARLKGENPDNLHSDKKPVYKPPDKRTQQLQVDDLLDEISKEVELESHLPNNITELENRLTNLKGGKNENARQNPDKDENDLNRGEAKDTKPYVRNIPSEEGKKSNEEGGEISAEEINKILEETSKECELEARKALKDLEKDKDIMKRLQEIKARRNDDINKQGSETEDKENPAENSDTDNEDQQASDVIKQIMEEDKLDEAAAKDGISINQNSKGKKAPKLEKEEEEDDELPYCCICTEDATIRCHGCDLDLYCNRCWKESHIDFQMEDHVTSKYIKPKG